MSLFCLNLRWNNFFFVLLYLINRIVYERVIRALFQRVDTMCWSHLFWPRHCPVVWKGASCCRISSLSQGKEMFGSNLFYHGIQPCCLFGYFQLCRLESAQSIYQVYWFYIFLSGSHLLLFHFLLFVGREVYVVAKFQKGLGYLPVICSLDDYFHHRSLWQGGCLGLVVSLLYIICAVRVVLETFLYPI